MNLDERRRQTTIRPCPAARAARAALAALACLAAASAQADTDPSPPAEAPSDLLRLNGFGTVALVDVTTRDAWGFRRETMQPAGHDDHVRADVDSRLGLQATWRPHPQLDVTAQVVLKPEAHDAHWTERLAWAFATWRPTDDWTLRIGRTSPDLFLLADVRNVGFSYPWIRPNTQFYSWMPLSNVDGVDVAKRWDLGATRWRAKLFAGRSSVTFASNHDDGDTRGTVSPLLGATLTMEVDGLTAKATFASARTHPIDAAPLVQLHDVLQQVAALPVPSVAADAATLAASFPGNGVFVTHYASLGAAWDSGPWMLQGEITRTEGNFSTSNAWSGYASFARRVGNATLFGVFGASKARRSPLPQPDWIATLAPLVGPQAAATAEFAAMTASGSSNRARVDERGLSLGARYDLTAQVALKLQVDRIRSAAYGGGLWAYDTCQPHAATVVSAGSDFIF